MSKVRSMPTQKATCLHVEMNTHEPKYAAMTLDIRSTLRESLADRLLADNVDATFHGASTLGSRQCSDGPLMNVVVGSAAGIVK
jgi:hypothetical protein